MAKVKVRVLKGFATRDLKRFDPSLVTKFPVLQREQVVFLEESAKEYLDKFSPGTVASMAVVPEAPEATKTETPPPPPPPPPADEDTGEDEETPPPAEVEEEDEEDEEDEEEVPPSEEEETEDEEDE